MMYGWASSEACEVEKGIKGKWILWLLSFTYHTSFANHGSNIDLPSLPAAASIWENAI